MSHKQSKAARRAAFRALTAPPPTEEGVLDWNAIALRVFYSARVQRRAQQFAARKLRNQKRAQ